MKKIMLLLFLVLVLIVTGCSDENQKVDQDEEIEEVGAVLEEDKIENKDNGWSYKYRIEIDEKTITNGDIEVYNRDFKIIFAEHLNEELSSTRSLDDKESLSGDRQDHLKIVGIEPTNITWTDGTIVTALVYEFENVPGNTNFKLELTDELKEIIGLNNTIINVYVK